MDGLLERLKCAGPWGVGLGVAGSLGLCAAAGCSYASSKCRRPKPQGPLAGVTVLDMSVVIAAPMAGALLSELGAEVIKVESLANPDSARGLGTSPARGMGGMLVGAARGKQSVILNLKSKEGIAAFMAIAAKCDVVLQNYRPGAVDRMGVGYEDVKKVNPDIIYLSSSGFGPTGPYAAGRIYDPIIQVLSGLADVQRNADGKAKLAAQVIFDKATAMASTQAVVAALLARDRGAGGQHILMSMLDLALQWMWPDNYYNQVWQNSSAKPSPPIHTANLYAPPPAGPPASVAAALADPEAAPRLETFESSFPMFGQITAPRYPVQFSATPTARRPGPPMMGEHTVKVLREVGIGAAELGEMLDSGHAVSTQRLMLNMAKQLTKAGNAAGAKAAGKGAKAFGLVEMLQSGSTFRGASAATEPPRRWKSTDGPLSGTTVLDCSVQLAGSMAAMVLADQGAETIQAELPGGGGGGARQLGQQPSSSTTDLGAMHMVLNRNKKSFALCEGGEEALAAELLGLCRLADVVFVDEGCPTTSSLTYDSARGVNPSIIFVSISHGGGEWAVQARSGQCADQLDADGQPTTVRSLVNEKSAAMYAAAAATAALLARGRGLGGSVAGQAAKVDMLGVALHSCQTDTLMNHLWHKKGGSGAARFPTIGDCYRTGELSDGTNVFVLALSNQECADFVAAFEEKISPEVRAKLETGKWKEIPGRIRDLDELWAWFFDVIRHYDWPEFEKRCKKHSIAHGKVLRAADEVLQDAQVVANDIVATVESSAGAHRLARPAAKFSATPCSIRHAAPLLGQHTAELKAQIAAKSL